MSEKNIDLVPVGTLPPLGVVPRRMHGWVVRKETHGEPLSSFREEVVDTPEPGPNEVLGLSMAAGVTLNAAALSRSILTFTDGLFRSMSNACSTTFDQEIDPWRAIAARSRSAAPDSARLPPQTPSAWVRLARSPR